jgi:hypothetical protein
MEEPIDYDDPVERVFATVLSNQYGKAILPTMFIMGAANFVGIALLGPMGVLAGPIAGATLNYFYEDTVFEKIAKTKVGRRKFVYAMANFLKVEIEQIHTAPNSSLIFACKEVLENMSETAVKKTD